MREEVRGEILNVLEEALDALEKREYAKLKGISNHTIHTASIYQDEDSISVAVILYSLYKVIQRCEEGDERICVELQGELRKAYDSLDNDDDKSYRKEIKHLLKALAKHDQRFEMFIEDVVAQANVKKGSKLYEHGISLGRAAELLGISEWELMEYIGNTTIADFKKERIPILDRIETARRLFT